MVSQSTYLILAASVLIITIAYCKRELKEISDKRKSKKKENEKSDFIISQNTHQSLNIIFAKNRARQGIDKK